MRRTASLLSLTAALLFFAAPAFATPVTLNAVGAPGGPILNQPVEWKIIKLDKTGEPSGAAIATGIAPSFKTDLPPGRYVLVATLGATKIQQGLIVGSNKEDRNIVITPSGVAASAAPAATTAAKSAAKPAQTAALATPAASLGSARLNIGMIQNSGRAAITEPINWQVYTYIRGATENGQMVATKLASNANFTLPAGGYVVRAAYKGTQVDLVIPLQAGQSYTYTINLYAGQAKLNAVKPSGSVREAVNWQIVREKPDANGQYQLVTSSSEASPQLLIREGRYLVIGRIGDLWGVQPLSVTAGHVTTAKVKLQKSEGAPIVVASAN